jgi:predicted transcriptional regulator
MNDSIGFALMHAGHRIEARLEKALAGVKLSGAKHAALSFLVIQDQPISLSELAEKLTCVRSNITQLVDRLGHDGLTEEGLDLLHHGGDIGVALGDFVALLANLPELPCESGEIAA